MLPPRETDIAVDHGAADVAGVGDGPGAVNKKVTGASFRKPGVWFRRCWRCWRASGIRGAHAGCGIGPGRAGTATLAGAANYREPGSVAHLLSALARAHPDVAGERVQQCRVEVEAVAEEYMALLEDADVAWEPDPEDAIELEAE